MPRNPLIFQESQFGFVVPLMMAIIAVVFWLKRDAARTPPTIR